MDNTEEIYKLIGKLVVDAHLKTAQLQYQIKDLLTENAQLKDMLQTGANEDESQ